MDYPENPSQPFRVATLAPALLTILALAMIQPFLVAIIQTLPADPSDPVWRTRILTLLLGAAPQIAVELAVFSAIGIFAYRYAAVRAAAMVSLLLVALMIPALVLNWLDMLQVRRLVPHDRLRAFDLNALEVSGLALTMVPLLCWLAWAGLRAGRRAPTADAGSEDVLMVGKEPLPAPYDPRVVN